MITTLYYESCSSVQYYSHIEIDSRKILHLLKLLVSVSSMPSSLVNHPQMCIQHTHKLHNLVQTYTLLQTD